MQASFGMVDEASSGVVECLKTSDSLFYMIEQSRVLSACRLSSSGTLATGEDGKPCVKVGIECTCMSIDPSA
jgi:hypothetical protein